MKQFGFIRSRAMRTSLILKCSVEIYLLGFFKFKIKRLEPSSFRVKEILKIIDHHILYTLVSPLLIIAFSYNLLSTPLLFLTNFVPYDVCVEWVKWQREWYSLLMNLSKGLRMLLVGWIRWSIQIRLTGCFCLSPRSRPTISLLTRWATRLIEIFPLY